MVLHVVDFLTSPSGTLTVASARLGGACVAKKCAIEPHYIQFVEVKGPGDQLSHKQLVWLSRLLSWGCQVEVCRVRGMLICM